MKFLRIWAVLALIVATSGVVGTAKADTLRWSIKSDYQYTVSLEFYSQKYNRAWPGNGKVWIIDDYQTHDYNLECEYGEQICYGAWVRNNSDTYWGVGPNNSHSCTNCCGTCGKGDMRGITLQP